LYLLKQVIVMDFANEGSDISEVWYKDNIRIDFSPIKTLSCTFIESYSEGCWPIKNLHYTRTSDKQ
jgi:hypothetical protein